jgi:hypothetical protein
LTIPEGVKVSKYSICFSNPFSLDVFGRKEGWKKTIKKFKNRTLETQKQDILFVSSERIREPFYPVNRKLSKAI